MALALLTLFFAGLAFWMARFVFAKVRTERFWPTVPGTILERRVGEAMGGRGRSYLPHVKYTYSVAGTEYTNDQVYLIRRTGGLAKVMQRLVDDLPDTVPVHYDPKDPTQSYLVINPLGTAWLLVAFGVFALLMAVMRMVVG